MSSSVRSQEMDPLRIPKKNAISGLVCVLAVVLVFSGSWVCVSEGPPVSVQPARNDFHPGPSGFIDHTVLFSQAKSQNSFSAEEGDPCSDHPCCQCNPGILKSVEKISPWQKRLSPLKALSSIPSGTGGAQCTEVKACPSDNNLASLDSISSVILLI